MIKCPQCGYQNRSNARFCQQCGIPLEELATTPAPAEETVATATSAPTTPEPAAEDPATAATQPIPTTAPASATSSTQPLVLPAGAPAQDDGADDEDGALEPGASVNDAYIIQSLLAETEGQRSYRATLAEPWRRCSSCGQQSQPNDPFCSECGAQLSTQTILLQETVGETPTGAALIADLPDEELAQTALPQLLDVLMHNGRRFAVLPESGSARLIPLADYFREDSPRLDEADALQMGLVLSRTLALLHRSGLALGRLKLSDLGLTLDHKVRLADASALRISQGPEDQADDLQQLIEVLEQLTGIERSTRRLSEEAAAEAVATGPVSGLPDILRNARTGSIADSATLAQSIEQFITEQATPTPMRTRIGYATDVGMVRQINEDSLLTWDLRMSQDRKLRNAGLYIVADGMGGHEAGEDASNIAICTIAQFLLPSLLAPAMRSEPFDARTLGDQVRAAVRQANVDIADEGRKRGNDMGTTTTMAVVLGNRALIANVGDSRTYIFREGKLRRVSRDHSLVMRLVEAGQISEQDIYTHPNRNAILRSLGEGGDLEVDIFEERIQPGDTLLLCSDGLWEMVHDREMEKILTEYEDVHEASAILVRDANIAGGEDNIAVVLVRFSEAQASGKPDLPEEGARS